MRKKIAFLLISAFVLRVASIFILKWHINPDIWEYDEIALNILSGRGYVFEYLGNDCFFFGSAPLYAYFEALIHYITDRNYLALEIIQAAIAAFSVMPLLFIAKKIFNKNIAMLVGFLYCFHPGLIVYTIKIHEFTLVMFFILTITYFVVCLEARKWMPAVTGILLGLGIFIRPTLIFLIPAFLVYLVIKKEKVKDIILKLSIITILAAAVIAPWIYRGYNIYKRFIFITTTSTEHFWRGNNPASSGTALTRDKQPVLSATSEEFRRKVYSLNEIEQHDFFKREAIAYIKTHPLQFIKNTTMKFFYFWSFSPQTGLKYPAHWLVIYKTLYYFLAMFFVISMYFVFKNRNYIDMPSIGFLLSVFLMVSFVQSLHYVETRHRWMLAPLIMIFSAYGIERIFLQVFCQKKIE